ncbi:MAG: hypothetical protein ACC707_19110 [Thiohalomonadales bacterium]
MSNKAEKLERLSARLDEESQKKVEYLRDLGYGPTELVREGIDLLYQQAMKAKVPSIPALLKTLSESSGEGPTDLSVNYKKYYKDLLIARKKNSNPATTQAKGS